MDFIYDEISPDKKQQLIAYLESHPDMMDELKELRKMQKLLGQMAPVEKGANLHIVETRKRSFGQWLGDAQMLLPRTGWGKAALATAACLLLMMVVGALARVQLSSTQAGFSVSLGYRNHVKPAPKTIMQKPAVVSPQFTGTTEPEINKNVLTQADADRFFTDAEAKAMLATLYEQNKQLLSAFAEEMNEHDRQQLQKVVKYFQAQRIYDLKQISKGMTQTQLANAYRWQQTNKALVDFVQAVSVDGE